MTTIQYYLKPRNPVDIAEAPRVAVDLTPPFTFTKRDLELLQPYRAKYGSLAGTIGVGTLYHTNKENGVYTCRLTEYGVFLAVDNSINGHSEFYEDPEILKGLDPEIRQGMRISSVGMLLRCRDAYLVQRRNPTAVSAPSKIDSGAAGICYARGNAKNERLSLDFVGAAHDKITEELFIGENLFPIERVISLKLSSTHHASDHPSGMFDFYVELDAYCDEISMNPRRAGKKIFIELNRLDDFIVKHAERGDFAYDGMSVLLSGLPYEQFLDVVGYINASHLGVEITYGRLNQGAFEREEWPVYSGNL